MNIFNHLIFKDLINTQMLSLLGGHDFLDFRFLPELMKKHWLEPELSLH